MKVVVSVNDSYLWCLPPFAYAFNKYWGASQEVVVVGYSQPGFSLPENFQYYSIDRYNYPKEKWVDGLMRFLHMFRRNNTHMVLMLEDYWLCRKVDTEGIAILEDYAVSNPNILRLDLTSDRLYAGGMKDVDYCNRFDIVQAKGSPYEMSLQAGIWNINLLMRVLDYLPEDKHSAWDVELEGTTIVNMPDFPGDIVGTRQCPVRYINAYNSTTGFNRDMLGMIDADRESIKPMLREIWNRPLIEQDGNK